jgi:hypothetical protein
VTAHRRLTARVCCISRRAPGSPPSGSGGQVIQRRAGHPKPSPQPAGPRHRHDAPVPSLPTNSGIKWRPSATSWTSHMAEPSAPELAVRLANFLVRHSRARRERPHAGLPADRRGRERLNSRRPCVATSASCIPRRVVCRRCPLAGQRSRCRSPPCSGGGRDGRTLSRNGTGSSLPWDDSSGLAQSADAPWRSTSSVRSYPTRASKASRHANRLHAGRATLRCQCAFRHTHVLGPLRAQRR